MKRILAGGIATLFLLVSVLMGSAMAHTFTANTSLTIHKAPKHATHPGHDVVIFGSLRSSRASCRSHKIVKLMKKRPGPDALLGRDRTDNEGDYSFLRNPVHDMTVYTRFSGSLNTSYGHSHQCLASRSPDLFINIR